MERDPNEQQHARIVDDRVLVNGRLAWWAFDRATGALAWTAEHGNRATPSPDGTRLALVDDEVTVRDVAHGDVRWNATWAMSHPGSAAWSPDGAIVYATWEDHSTPHVAVAAFEAASGARLWTAHHNLTSTDHFRIAHAVADERRVLLVGGGRAADGADGRLVMLALDADDGRLVWERGERADPYLGRSYRLDVRLDDALRVAGVSARTAFGVAVEPATGEVLSNWTRPVAFASSAGFDDGRVHVAVADGDDRKGVHVTVLDAATGASLLCSREGDLPATGPIDLAAADGRRFVATWDERARSTRVVAFPS